MTSNEEPAARPEGLVELGRTGDLFTARLLAGYLEANGIPTFIPGETTMTTYDGAAVLWSEGVPIEVPAVRADEARRLLAERERELGEGEGLLPEDDNEAGKDG